MLQVDGPISAIGSNGIWWSGWRIESEQQFRARVADDAARLGIDYSFDLQHLQRGPDRSPAPYSKAIRLSGCEKTGTPVACF